MRRRHLRWHHRGRAALALGAVMIGLGACSSMKVVDDTPESVSIRYDGVVSSLDDATAEANRLCAAHGKTAKLRETDRKAALESYAHYYCVSG
jgi:hypothetical protein